MPYETFIVKPAGDTLLGDRKREAVAKDISATFEKIRAAGGTFIAAIPLADETSPSFAGGHPEGALYIVADMPPESAQ